MQSLLTYTLEAGFYTYSQDGLLSLFEPDVTVPLTSTMFIGRAANSIEERACVGGEYTPLDPIKEGEYVFGSAWILEFMPRATCVGNKIVFPKTQLEISREHGAFDISCVTKELRWDYVHRSQSISQSVLWKPGEGITSIVSNKGEHISMQFSSKEGVAKNILLLGYLYAFIQDPKPIAYKSGYVIVVQRDLRIDGKRYSTYELPLLPNTK